ncbi:MAG: hypothetical protein ACJZ72_00305 [Opitutales bacterium]
MEGNNHLVIARKERSDRRGNPLHAIDSTDNALRLLNHSGSPRAFSPRDDNTLFHRKK